MEAGRDQFEAEVRSLLPEVKLGETSDKLTQDELNLLLAHAHRKVLHLQNQLARLQVLAVVVVVVVRGKEGGLIILERILKSIYNYYALCVCVCVCVCCKVFNEM